MTGYKLQNPSAVPVALRRPASPQLSASTVSRRPRLLMTAAGVLAYAYLLHYAYARLISPVFAYLGQTYRPPTPLAVFASVLMVFAVTLTMPRLVHRPSDIILWALHLLTVAPSILIAQYADILTPSEALTSALWIALLFSALTMGMRKFELPNELSFHIPAQFLNLFLFTSSVLVAALLFNQGGMSLSLVGLTDVQDVRASYKDLVSGASGLGYLIQFQMAVVNPILMSIGVRARKFFPGLAGALGQILVYSVTGYKLAILSPIFVIGLAAAVKYRRSLSGLFLTWAIGISMVISILVDSLSGGQMLVTVFINRLIVGPGVLTSAFIHVFQGEPKYAWSYSFLSPFVHNPYDLMPGYYVGLVFQKVQSQANASPFGDGYANLGWAGVAVELLFLALLLPVLDAASRRVPREVAIPSCLVAAIGLTNNSAFSSVLTGGLGGLIIVFALWPRADSFSASES